jgi:DNA-binding NarL/FixJ family response regulator
MSCHRIDAVGKVRDKQQACPHARVAKLPPVEAVLGRRNTTALTFKRLAAKVGERRFMAKSLTEKPPQSLTKIFIVEDHPVFREGLEQVLNKEPGLTVCGAAESTAEALKAIVRLQPDLVLVDIGLPGRSGLELIKELRAADQKVKLLVISMHDEALYADRVLRAGGDGYIMKQEDPEEIIHAIRDVLSGHIYVSEEVVAGTTKASRGRSIKEKGRPLDQLTDLELEVLEALGKGRTNREIAHQLRVSVAKVTSHCTQIRRKLKLKSANALIRYAVCWVETGKA